jgi:diaminopimelate epimerase
VDRNTVEMITWERGAGLTAACGTGASSVFALGIREGRLGPLASGAGSADGAGSGSIDDSDLESADGAGLESIDGSDSESADGAELASLDDSCSGSVNDAEVKVLLPYGELFIRQESDGEIFMKGPAEHIFDGEYDSGQ